LCYFLTGQDFELGRVAMTWLGAHWKVLTALVALFLVGVGVGSATLGDSGETMTVVRATTVDDPTAEQVAALDEREAALYALAREVRERREADLDALLQKFRQWKRALDERAAALRQRERIFARASSVTTD
jgi:hypothetical protein